MAPCAPIAFGSKDGELSAALEEGALGSIGDDRGPGSFVGPTAEAGISGVGLASGALPIIGAATVGTFVLLGGNAAAVVVPDAGARLVI